MANTIANTGYRKIVLNRSNKATPDYTVPADLFISLDENVPNISDASIVSIIPISDGSVLDDGSTTLTGSGAGTNSTDNTTTYKEGAGQSDDTAQNLIKDDSAVEAVWTGAIGSPYADIAKFASSWLYIKDSTALDKIVSIELRIGIDASNYYSQTYLNANLAVLWNFLTSEDVLGDWTETGTVTGNIDYFAVVITTNNATDTFAAGDIVYDLLRQWETSDTLKSLIANYPSLNETKLQSDHSYLLTLTEANGFFIRKYGVQNSDGTPILCFESLTDGDSKSRTDQFRISFKNIIR